MFIELNKLKADSTADIQSIIPDNGETFFQHKYLAFQSLSKGVVFFKNTVSKPNAVA